MRNKSIFVALFLGLVAFANPASAEDCHNDGFLKELRDTGDDFRAVTILKEKEFKLRGGDKGFECARILLGTYIQHEEFDVADEWLTKMISTYPQLQKMAPPNRLHAEMAYLFGNYAEVEKRIDSGPDFAGSEILRSFATASENPYSNPSISCSAPPCNDLRSIVNTSKNDGLKSPGLALALGIVPGMGQIYAGRTWSGVASFLLNSVLIGTTVYGINRGEYAFAILSGAATTGIYLGSIYAGYESVRRYNEQQESNARSKIKGINLDLQLLKITF